jgi:flagellar motility protein MotE (MotC chaperone)
MISEAVIAAIAGGLGSVIGVIGKVAVDIIKAKRAASESEDIKEDLETEKAIAEEKRKEFYEAVEKLNETMNARFTQLDEKIDEMKAQTDQHKNIAIVELRHSITEVYYQYCDKKSFSHNVKEDVCSLYEAYSKLGGNSYVHEIYEEMMSWEVK